MAKRVNSGLQEARWLVQHRGDHLVISLYLDLDPEHFATAPARASQIRSLLDAAHRDIDRLEDLAHEEKVALREDLKRIDSFLASSAAPFKGARALALFCSGPDELFETIQLSRPVPARVVIDGAPYVAPMIAMLQQHRWLVALVNRRSAWLLTGSPDRLRERTRVTDDVPGQQEQGGWSQANYERSVEKDVMDHLRSFAETVNRRFRRERFDRVVAGGPHEVVTRFKELLDSEVRERLAPDEVDVDLSSATQAQVRAKVEEIVIEDERRTEREALDKLAEGVGSGRRGVAGLDDTLKVLNERRVQTLLLAPGFEGQGPRCPTCGLLVAEPAKRCPADGAPMESVDLREAVVEAAVVQGAEVLVIRDYPDEEPRQGIGALLRF